MMAADCTNSGGAQPVQPVLNVAGTRVGIQILSANDPRVVAALRNTNVGAQPVPSSNQRPRGAQRALVYHGETNTPRALVGT